MADELYIIREGEKVAMTDEEIAAWKAEPPPAELPVVVDAMVFWERLTPAEAETVETAMGEQSARSRNLFQKAKTFRSDHELWPVLTQLAAQLFGEARAAELLAPSR